MQLIAFDYHAHLISKAGFVISSKSPSPAFRRSGIYYTEPKFTDKVGNIAFIIADESPSIMNVILPSLSITSPTLQPLGHDFPQLKIMVFCFNVL